MATTDQATHTNQLIGQTSPYLLQHAHNPVNWYPWGEEAFAHARSENKPIFLSIGYAACHWCHVMERESFENEEIAQILNERFISIKVDREERPDLDDFYMLSVQLISGGGGWPMSVFLTPDGKPFYGGTYYPPEDRQGRIGFKKLLHEISKLYEAQAEKLHENGEVLSKAISEHTNALRTESQVSLELLDNAVRDLRGRYDTIYGGFGEAPKFPPAMALNLLLREWRRTGAAQLLEMVGRTLDKMSLGGIYDQLGGGFHRYSVDQFWVAPHFEKMLYDNALLAQVYFNAALAAGQASYTRIGREVLDYVLREMTGPEGGFYSTQDADSEGREGKYYVWRPEEVIEALGPEDGALFCEYYEVLPEGNWAEGDGASILNVRQELEAFAHARGLDAATLAARLDGWRRRLLEQRARRVAPATDDKVIVSWNGLMISALARGAQVTGDERYAAAATRAAAFVLEKMRHDGGLLRTWRKGEAKINAFLDDYANLIGGLIDLYETTFDADLMREADALARTMVARFYDHAAGGFFTTDGRDPHMIARLKEFFDGATPSGNAAAVFALLRLGRLMDNEEMLEPARRTLRLLADQMRQNPAAHHFMLSAASFELGPPREVSIVGKPEVNITRQMLDALWHAYQPNRILALAPTDGSDGVAIEIAMLRNKPAQQGQPTAYVCQNYTCSAPVHTVQGLMELL